jgi:hypothetical protein
VRNNETERKGDLKRGGNKKKKKERNEGKDKMEEECRQEKWMEGNRELIN